MGKNVLLHKSVSWKDHLWWLFKCIYDDADDNFDKRQDNNDDDDDSNYDDSAQNDIVILGDDDNDFVEGFDKHPLVLAENPRTHQFYVPLDSPKVRSFSK